MCFSLASRSGYARHQKRVRSTSSGRGEYVEYECHMGAISNDRGYRWYLWGINEGLGVCFRDGWSMDLDICDGVIITNHSIPFIFRIDRGCARRKQTHSVVVHIKYPFARRVRVGKGYRGRGDDPGAYGLGMKASKPSWKRLLGIITVTLGGNLTSC